jgi:hypothetical protein
VCTATVTCIECGDELLEERAGLGYEYCTKKQCQAAHHRGLTITAVGVNKSADVLLVADEAEIRERGESGEFGKKNTALGIDYRATGSGISAAPEARATRAPSSHPVPAPRRAPGWTPEQERITRLYHGMGLNPRQIVERARASAPRLALTDSLVTKILCSRPLSR